jgi:tRNA threonylcarbamoyladenosine dehydratase
LNPSLVIESTLFKTSGDPLARIMRSSLKKHQLKDCRVVTSTETALPSTLDQERQSIVNGSMIFVPATAGLKMAAMLVEYLRTL